MVGDPKNMGNAGVWPILVRINSMGSIPPITALLMGQVVKTLSGQTK